MSRFATREEFEARAQLEKASRRALAALFVHHGDRPPEPGCSAEALAIRRLLAARPAAPDVRGATGGPVGAGAVRRPNGPNRPGGDGAHGADRGPLGAFLGRWRARRPAGYGARTLRTPLGGGTTMQAVLEAVAAEHGVSVAILTSRTRAAEMVRARHAVWALAWAETGLSLVAIGRATGGFDHSTVRHGILMHHERAGLPSPSGLVPRRPRARPIGAGPTGVGP